MKAKRAAIYVRVSTSQQETNMQEAELKEYCDNRSWTHSVFPEEGKSGAKSDRPGLNRMLDDMRKRKIDVIVVWALDRLARSLKQLLNIAENASRWE
jgi:putative DNA-invertase from lambdoid prophage Rac